MDTNPLTAPATKVNAAYQSRSLHTSAAPFALGHANRRKCVPFLIIRANVL